MKRKSYVKFRMFMFCDSIILLRKYNSRKKNRKLRAFTNWYKSESNIVPIKLDNIYMYSKEIKRNTL